MATGVAGKAAGIAGSIANNTVGLAYRIPKSIIGDAISQQSRHLGARMLRGLGLKGGYGKKTDKDGNPEPGSDDSESKNNEKANYGSNPNAAKDAINDDAGFKRSFGGNNENNKQPDKKNSTLGNTIQNGGSSTGKNQQSGKQQGEEEKK
jgi:hypothetical protein